MKTPAPNNLRLGRILETSLYADDLDRALAAFTEKRQKHLVDLRALTPEQWERTGRHVTNGPISILNNTLHAAWHDTNHLAQIARLLP